jgi:hypothetical protein
MFFFYVDESGDVGLSNSPSRFFALSGLVLHELCWKDTIQSILSFRQTLRKNYGLKLREEIHAAHFLHKPKDMRRIDKHKRLLILRDTMNFEAGLRDVNIVNVIVDKSTKRPDYDVFEWAWRVLTQRFENTISHRNFPGPQNPQDFGIIFTDRTDEKKLRGLLRKMRRYNPVPNQIGLGYRQMPVSLVVEDPVARDSLHSYFIQLADVNAYFLLQRDQPCGYVHQKGAKNYFIKLDPVLCKVASPKDPYGIVRL